MNCGIQTVNIDFLLSGCNTRCRHCYVAGGPGPLMAAEDALLCLEKLDALAACLPWETDFTLDHEPMNHPDLVRILRAAAGTKKIRNDHHGMTTGVALMARQDREEVLRAYQDCGYNAFGITIHGDAASHDEIVRRKGAWETAVRAAEFFRSRGAELEVSLMLNRFFPGDEEAVTALLSRLQPDFVGCVIPIYTPHPGMGDFEPYRASLAELQSLAGALPLWRQDPEPFLERARQRTPSAAAERLRKGPGLKALFEAPQEELYLSLHPDCVLYAGNSGAETRALGDLRTADPEELAARILELPGNRDYGAFYDPAALPETEVLARALEQLPGEPVYGDFESVLYRGLSAMGTETRILPSVHFARPVVY